MRRRGDGFPSSTIRFFHRQLGREMKIASCHCNIPFGPLGLAAMPAPIRVVLLATALAGWFLPLPCVGQTASPYITLDDPRLPLLEHLIARGDVEDPSPMVRPFRRADAVRVLAAADTGNAGLSAQLI